MGTQTTCPYCGYVESGNRKHAYLPARYLLQDRYLIGEVISGDKNGVCYKAADIRGGEIVEVQEHFPREIVMRDSDGVTVTALTQDDADWPTKEVKTLLRNAQSMMQFTDCDGIIRVRDTFEANRTVYIVNEYLEGMTLEDYLRANGGTVDAETALSIIIPVLDGLTKLHEANLIHRAVTPKNIILTSDNTVKLINYVFLKEASPFQESEMTVYFSPGYAPYEQYVSKERRGSYSDIYSVGAVLYRMLIGAPPQDAVERNSEDRLREQLQAAELPEYLALCIRKAMDMNKDIRFKSAADMKSALLQKEPVADVDGYLNRAQKRRRIGIIIALTAVLAVLLAILAVLIHQYV
jgi:serine/threonine protein kinase